jgi:hypothetical protein
VLEENGIKLEKENKICKVGRQLSEEGFLSIDGRCYEAQEKRIKREKHFLAIRI